MEELFDLVEQIHANAKRIRNDPTAQVVGEEKRALLGAYQYALEEVVQTMDWLNQRTCPGPYWRMWDHVKERIDESVSVKAEGAIRKRRKPNVECKSKTPTFQRAEYGPLREDDGERMLCDACCQQLRKDRQQGFLK